MVVTLTEEGAMKRLLYSKKAAPYLFVLPFVITLLVFWAVPIVRSFMMSFQELLYGQATFIGFRNYERMVGDRVFWQAVGNSFRYMVLTLVLLIPIPMVLAAILNSKIGSPRIKNLFKASLFVPALTSIVVAGLVFRLMFSESDSAMVNQVLDFIGFGPVRWLREDIPGLLVLLVLALWRWTGVNTMYFLAGMQSIPQAYGAINSGDFAAVVYPAWYTSRFVDYMPDLAGKIAIAPAPVPDGAAVKTIGGGGTGTAVIGSSPVAEFAADWLAFAKLSPEANVAVWEELGFDPVNMSVWEDEAVTHNPDNKFNQYFQTNLFDVLNQVKDGIGHWESFSSPNWPSVDNLFRTVTLNEAFENKVPAQQVLEQAQTDLENELG